MNETDWQACTDPRVMLRFLRQNAGEDVLLRSWFTRHAEYQLPRKWRFFLATCCSRIAPLLNKRDRRVVEFATSFVDQIPTEAAVERLSIWSSGGGIQSRRLIRGLFWPLSSAAGQLRSIAGHKAFRSALIKSELDWERQANVAMRSAVDAEAASQSELIRTIIGLPFRL